MDVYCPTCAGQRDTDEFHEVAAERGTCYEVVAAAFRSTGCEALGMGKCKPSRETRGRAMAISALYDLLGDDMDGAAAMIEDFDFLDF